MDRSQEVWYAPTSLGKEEVTQGHEAQEETTKWCPFDQAWVGFHETGRIICLWIVFLVYFQLIYNSSTYNFQGSKTSAKPLDAFWGPKNKKQRAGTSSSSSVAAACAQRAGTSSSSSVAAACALDSNPASKRTSTSTSFLSMNAGKMQPVEKICEGIFPDYCTSNLQPLLVSYCQHAKIAEATKYKVGFANSCSNLFSKKCVKKGVFRRTRKGNIFSCYECHGIYVSQ